MGRGEACAIRIENASASRTHCALLRGASTAYVIDLLGRRTLLNDRPVEGASVLLDGDILTIGQACFAVRLEPPSPPRSVTAVEPASAGSTELALGPREALLTLLRNAADPTGSPASFEILDTLRQFQADTATLLKLRSVGSRPSTARSRRSKPRSTGAEGRPPSPRHRFAST